VNSYGSQNSENARKPSYREAQVLLRELQHRVGNEVASAVAAMRIAQHSGIQGPKVSLFDQAIARLEGFGQVHTMLSSHPPRMMDVREEMHRLCRGLLKGRSGLDGARVHLAVDPPMVPGGPAHRILLIAAELLHNAIRHALADRGGGMTIDVRCDSYAVFLTVSDDGPGLGASHGTSGTGLGSDIVNELVRMGDGCLVCDSDGQGTTFRVTLPLSGPSPMDWLAAETIA